MADDEWYDLAEPLLEYIHANAPKMGSMNVGAIADALRRATLRLLPSRSTNCTEPSS